MGTKFTKQFAPQKAEATRVCTNCGCDINKGEKCLNFTFAEKKTFQVSGNLCKRCLWNLTYNILK